MPVDCAVCRSRRRRRRDSDSGDSVRSEHRRGAAARTRKIRGAIQHRRRRRRRRADRREGVAHLPGDAATAERLGGISATCARQLEKLTGKETRYVVLGHLQRGGTPTSHDRILATRFGGKAVECVLNGEFDVMVAFAAARYRDRAARRWSSENRSACRADFDLIRTARAMGITFGDGVRVGMLSVATLRRGREAFDRLRKRRHFLRRGRAAEQHGLRRRVRAVHVLHVSARRFR